MKNIVPLWVALTLSLSATAADSTSSELASTLAQEITLRESVHSEASFSEMLSIYRNKLESMNREMESAPNKKVVMTKYLVYLRHEILNQTDGEGMAYSLVSHYEEKALKRFSLGDYDGARAVINESFGRVVSLF